MIPKQIHYIWFGGNELPDDALQCMESWQKYCPEYEVIRWDESNFDVSINRYVEEAYESKKWAFVSDYVRLWALVNYGGIYMDTDVELTAPIDQFLTHRAFSGFESNKSIPTGIMGCEKDFPLFQALLDDYSTRSFIQDDGSFDLTTNVIAITEACLSRGLVLNNEYQEIDGLALYPSDWFCPKSHETGAVNITSNTRAIHHFSGSWLDPVERQLVDRKLEILARHPNMPHLFVGAYVRIMHGFSTGDFAPFMNMFRMFLRGR
ncbi:MAG: glycosyl transferase [Clostridiaceae bacterium]|uniref:Glycosyl transferase n=1 Tax=Collinsella intestinalis TaxID=147207 RepID=A0A943BQ99_9ACTN|nr:glycosyl transferase [Collinsella intestinalis]MBS7225450.1 glycosyl transferase [Clostridiaceae bacterium]